MPFIKKNSKQRHKALFSLWDKVSILTISALAISLTLLIAGKDILPGFDGEHKANVSLPSKLPCELQKIIDGDTVQARCQQHDWRIRLLGIDAPETEQAPWGERSKQVLAQRLPHHFMLINQGLDVYQRVLGTIYVGDEDINLAMITAGAAVAYDGAETPREYFLAEQRAKKAKIGIWSEPGNQQDPRLWRRYHQ